MASFVSLGACQVPADKTAEVTPSAVVGLDRTGVERLLGQPNFVVRESPAAIWQYHGGDCVLDLFLYDQAEGQRVTYVEARSIAAAEPVAAAGCLQSVLNRRDGYTDFAL